MIYSYRYSATRQIDPPHWEPVAVEVRLLLKSYRRSATLWAFVEFIEDAPSSTPLRPVRPAGIRVWVPFKSLHARTKHYAAQWITPEGEQLTRYLQDWDTPATHFARWGKTIKIIGYFTLKIK